MRIRITRLPILASLGFALVLGVAIALPVRGESSPSPSLGAASQLVTLLAHDDLHSSLNLRTCRSSAVVRGGEIDLSSVQLMFHRFSADQLSFGFVGHEAVNVVDVGDLFVPGFSTARDLAPKFAPSIFHSLVLDGIKVSYRGSGNRLLRLKAAQSIFDPLPHEGIYHITPIVGHTYIVRVEPRKAAEELFKFEVVDFQPNHSLTLRVGRLDQI